MCDRVRLYAWAAPALDTNALPDHTWVTTYDNRKIYPDIKAVRPPLASITGIVGENFGRKAERREIQQGYWATALAVSWWPLAGLPDKDCRSTKAARGTVFRYARDGVCHQLANQVLYAAAPQGGAQVTVAKARGYWWSVFRFGTYGRNESDWIAQRDSCSSGR